MKVEPITMQVVLEDMPESNDLYRQKPGVFMDLLVRFLNRHLPIETSSPKILSMTGELSAVDSTGRVLEPLKYDFSNSGGLFTNKRNEGTLKVRAENPPSPGATWIHLKGSLVIPVTSEIVRTKPRVLKLEKGVFFEEADGSFKIEYRGIKEHSNNEYSSLLLYVTSTRPGRIYDLEFVNRDGSQIKSHGGGSGPVDDEGIKKRSVREDLEIPADLKEIRVVIVYNKDTQFVKVPVDFKMGLSVQ